MYLNEHRLTGDIQWPASTPFEMAIGPLAGSFPILSLRTNKADVVVGVDQGVADKLDELDNRKWRYDGRYVLSTPTLLLSRSFTLLTIRYALISFAPKSV
jgi:hypothetical protein